LSFSRHGNMAARGFSLSLSLLLLLFLAGAARASDCSAAEWWAFAARDTQIAFVYRFDGEAGISAALAYYAQLDVAGYPHPYWPPSWQVTPLLGVITSNASCAAARAVLANATAPLAHPDAIMLLSALLRYGAFLSTNRLGCPDDHAFPIYDAVTDQLRCGCAEGHTCLTTTDASAGTWSSTFALATAAVTLTMVLAAAAIIANAVFLHRATAALRTVEIMPKKKQ
jgi:hypothetical protein